MLTIILASCGCSNKNSPKAAPIACSACSAKGNNRAPANTGSNARGKWTPKGAKLPAQMSTKASLLGGGASSEDHLREAVILAVLIRNPLVLNDFYGQLERMTCSGADTTALRDALLRMEPKNDLEDALKAEMG